MKLGAINQDWYKLYYKHTHFNNF